MVSLFLIFKREISCNQYQVYKYAKKTDRAPGKEGNAGNQEVDVSMADSIARDP